MITLYRDLSTIYISSVFIRIRIRVRFFGIMFAGKMLVRKAILVLFFRLER